MADNDFDPERPHERAIAADAADERSDFLGLMGHAYRGELSRMSTWRSRIDRTTNWAVVLIASLLTWTFSAETRPHYLLVGGMIMVTIFLGIEARRYRIYDVWRSRVRVLEENVFAPAIDPTGVEDTQWRELLSTDLRTPRFKIPLHEAVTRRLRRVYFPLLSVLVAAWWVRLLVFEDAASVGMAAQIGEVSGTIVAGAVMGFYLILAVITVWPHDRQAKGELRGQRETDDW